MAVFEIRINNEFSLKGNDYIVEQGKANLVVITGMDEHSKRYEYFAHAMNDFGISVYVLDHFGQGENAASVEDLQKWPRDAWKLTLEALNIKIRSLKSERLPAYLMGHSMGSFAVQAYIETYPDSPADKYVIMGSNGPDRLLYAAAYIMADVLVTDKNWDEPSEFFTKLALGPYAKSIKDRRTNLDWLSYDTENVDKYIADPYCGQINTNGFYHEFFKGMKELYKPANIAKIPADSKILIVSGTDDPVGKNSKGIEKLYKMYRKAGVKDVKKILYPHCRHEILNEKIKDDVIEDIKKFLG